MENILKDNILIMKTANNKTINDPTIDQIKNEIKNLLINKLEFFIVELNDNDFVQTTNTKNGLLTQYSKDKKLVEIYTSKENTEEIFRKLIIKNYVDIDNFYWRDVQKINKDRKKIWHWILDLFAVIVGLGFFIFEQTPLKIRMIFLLVCAVLLLPHQINRYFLSTDEITKANVNAKIDFFLCVAGIIGIGLYLLYLWR